MEEVFNGSISLSMHYNRSSANRLLHTVIINHMLPETVLVQIFLGRYQDYRHQPKS